MNIVDSVLFVCMTSVSDKWLSETREPGTWYCERHCCRILPPRLLGYLWGANRVQMGFLSWSFLICMSEPRQSYEKAKLRLRIQEIVQFALCSEPLNPTRQKAQRVLVVEHLVIHLTSLTMYLVCASNNIHTNRKGQTWKYKPMVWNNTKSSFTCSQPTSSKCMVPAAPHTAVQFALCSEPLNPTRQELGGYW